MTPEQIAIQIVENTLNQPVQSIRRFETGLCHFTYDIVTGDNRPLVARLAQPGNEALLEGAVYWSERLRPQGVPLPELLGYDLTCRKFPLAYLLLERLPGQDLGQVYPGLTVSQKRRIAHEVARIQTIANRLPPGPGYGFAVSYQASLKASWTAVLQAELDRSRLRIGQAGVFRVEVVDRVQGWLARFEAYLAGVAPTPFLDDTTTKNVIVHQGQLSGIVDVDMVCFGDPLFVIALTRMSLIVRDYSLDYIEFWCEQLNLRELQRRVLHFYTAVFCVNFMSEIGHKFNREDPLEADKSLVARLYYLLDELQAGLN
jgi:aminoglycoside phosphotransferase (APT) family kinase protein